MTTLTKLGRGFPCAAALACTSLMTLHADAGTLRVPQEYPNIQAAIDQATAGDTVLVAPGLYMGPGNRDLNPHGKAITIRSVAGPGSCIIHAGGSAMVYRAGFVIETSEPESTVIQGFTVTGGYEFNGGGFMIHSGSPTIRDCVITGNTADCWGAGVYIASAGAPRFINCRVSGNVSTDEGGGFFIIGPGSPVIEGCVIADNTARAGAGITTFWGDPAFINCRITGNSASWGGAGYTFTGRFINCTIANNSATLHGSAFYSPSSATVMNSIIWGNSGERPLSGNVITSYSIVQGGAAGVGNRSTNPMFQNPAAGDFRIADGSPAIDAGSNQLVPAGVLTDFAGAARFLNDPRTVDSGAGAGPIVDIGAFEFRRTMTVRAAP